MLSLMLMFFVMLFFYFFVKNLWDQICLFFLSTLFLSLMMENRFFFTSISLVFGQDSFSKSLLYLSVWILVLSILSSKKIFFTSSCNNFFITISILNFILFLTFSCLNSLLFFFLFESTLIPTLYLILGWGYKVERISSGLYMLIYTLFGSLPLLMMIMVHLLYFYTLYFNYMFFYESSLVYLCLMFGFLIKMPMFLVHSWLPKAHVEAPVSGSMILAGVLLKLGGYGIYKFMFSIYSTFSKMSFIFMCMSLMGGVMSSFICLRQTDMKSLIAYSSVAHMSLVIGGFFSQNLWGLQFSFLMMIAHGLCSSGLFYLSNINYERCLTRSIYINKGFINIFPNLSMWWFVFNACNMACPPSLNLLSEIGLFNSIMSWSLWLMLFLSLISFLSACYSLYLFSFSQHGFLNSKLICLNICLVGEFLILFLHFIPLNLVFLYMEIFM